MNMLITGLPNHATVVTLDRDFQTHAGNLTANTYSITGRKLAASKTLR